MLFCLSELAPPCAEVQHPSASATLWLCCSYPAWVPSSTAASDGQHTSLSPWYSFPTVYRCSDHLPCCFLYGKRPHRLLLSREFHLTGAQLKTILPLYPMFHSLPQPLSCRPATRHWLHHSPNRTCHLARRHLSLGMLPFPNLKWLYNSSNPRYAFAGLWWFPGSQERSAPGEINVFRAVSPFLAYRQPPFCSSSHLCHVHRESIHWTPSFHSFWFPQVSRCFLSPKDYPVTTSLLLGLRHWITTSAPLPHGQVYPLSLPEQRAMEHCWGFPYRLHLCLFFSICV